MHYAVTADIDDFDHGLAATVGVGGPLPADNESGDVRAAQVLARMGARAATRNRRDVAREAAAVLREAGARVDAMSVRALADTVEAHPGLKPSWGS